MSGTSEVGKPPRQRMARAKMEQVKLFLLQHSGAKDLDVFEEFKGHVSRRLIAYARSELVKEGHLPPPRKFGPKGPGRPRKDMAAQKPGGAAETPAPNPSYAGQLLTPENLAALVADPELEGETDLEAQRRMKRESKRMAFDLKLHPDTRMSAMQLWVKLRDAERARDLGPGRPLTREAALARLNDIHTAVGQDLTIVSVLHLWGARFIGRLLELFGHKETPDASPDDEAPTADSAPSAPSSTGHEGAEAPTEVVRPVDVEGRGDGGAATDHRDNDSAGPTP